MSNFTVKITTGDETLLELAGQINEDSNFSEMENLSGEYEYCSLL